MKLTNTTLEIDVFALEPGSWPDAGFNNVKKILTYPRKVREEFEHYNFLSILTSENDIDYSIYTGRGHLFSQSFKRKKIDSLLAKIMEENDALSMQGLMNYAVNTTFTSTSKLDI